MKAFTPVSWDAALCHQELEALADLLAAHSTLTERTQILPFFRQHRQLAAFLGSYHSDLTHDDRLAFEYDLFGDFSCDLVAGDSVKRTYCFVEFEDAGPHSVFKREGKKSTRVWSPRFDHGYSQIIDWFRKLRDAEKSDDYETRFGARVVVVDSRKVQCVTYDELLLDLSARLERYDVIKSRR